MNVDDFLSILDADFFAGVPDSLLKPFVSALMVRYGRDPQYHVIAANEGNAAAIAEGYHLATGRVPVVYLQTSGEGNVINPEASILHRAVYGIPALFVIGWRGEPGTKDEPQHMEQGKITVPLLDVLDIPHFVIGIETTAADVQAAMEGFRTVFAQGGDAAFVVSKGALIAASASTHQNDYSLRREEILRHILDAANGDLIVATTGKASRELFELREARGEDHAHDFLTVGSMGHASMIAMGIAKAKPEQLVICLDGDGATLMQMGNMAIVGQSGCENLLHIVLNNAAHDSVGGQPTVADAVRLSDIAQSCGYSVATFIPGVRTPAYGRPMFMEILVAKGARKDLGRPKEPPQENKDLFMRTLAK